MRHTFVWVYNSGTKTCLYGGCDWISLQHSLQNTHMHSCCLPSFLCIISSFIAFSLFRCQSKLYVSMALLCFVVGPLQAQLCLTRVLLLSIDIDRASRCVSLNLCHLLYLYFSIYSLHLSTYPLTPPHPLFSGLRSFFLFFLSECSALLVSFSVLGSQDYIWRGQYNPLSTLFTANPVQYYRFIHLHPWSCVKVIFSVGYEVIAFSSRFGWNLA